MESSSERLREERPARHRDRPEAERPVTEEPSAARRPASLNPRSALMLQGRAGNRAVSRLMAQRTKTTAPTRASTVASPQGTTTPTSTTQATPDTATPDTDPLQRLVDGRPHANPAQDPKFNALKRDVKSKRGTMAKHPPAKNEANAAAKAAKPPQDDKEAQGKAANAEKMNKAKPGGFDKAAFIRAVNAAIAKKAPKNLEEADEFGDSGKADDVKNEVNGKVGDGKKSSASAIESTTTAPPDTAAAKDKPVTPLSPDRPPPKPGTPDPAKAIPDKAPAAATDFSEGPREVDGQLADAEVTEEQLAKSNEPEFTGALKEKKAGEAHSATAPGVVRGKEAATLNAAKADAKQSGATAMNAMTAVRRKSGQDVTSGKNTAQTEDEKKRIQVNAKLQTVFDATKKDVEGILTGLDKLVDDKFTKDEKTARDAFTADHKSRMNAYKDKRYSGWTGGLKWAKDKLTGMPSEANQIFVVARQGYVKAMQGVISGVADLIGTELNKAKDRITKGRADLKAAVAALPPDLRSIGAKAAEDFSGKFDELTESVDNKGNELVDTLASKYTDALKSVDDEIAAEKEKNKGLVAKAIDAVKGVIQTILELKNLLLGVLAKAASAIGAIIKDPIGFLGNLVSAVGAGLAAFIANIGTHLKKGLVSWLLGAATKAGLELPEKFDLKGILGMVASLLGLTWGAIKGRIVAKGVPAEAMTAVEAGVPMVQKVQSGGIGALWEDIKEKVGDLKETLLSKISEYLIPTVLIAGITWIVSLLNPASAFIKACKAIIDIVTFIVQRGAQIAEFVNAILDSVVAIAKGGSGGVGALIENALAKSVPVLIGFLAALLGVGGIAEKVKKIFQAIAKPVNKAIDWVVGKIVGLGKKIWAKMKGAFGKDKKGKDGKPGDAKKDPKIREKVAADVNAAVADGVDDKTVQPALRGIFNKHKANGLDMLEARKGSTPGAFEIAMAASPVTVIRTTKVDPGDPTARQLLDGGNPYAEFGFQIPRNVVLSGSFTLPESGKPGGFGETNALGELHTATRATSYEKKTSKDENTHAEDLLIGEVKSTWDSRVGSREEETKAGADRPDAVLTVKVTRSPCARCAGRLGALRSWASSAKQWNLGVEVSSLGLYHGKTDVTDAEGKKATVRGPTSGREGLLRLKEWGISITPMAPDDPAILKEFSKLSPADQRAMIVKIEAYNEKLDRAIKDVDKVQVTLKKI